MSIKIQSFFLSVLLTFFLVSIGLALEVWGQAQIEIDSINDVNTLEAIYIEYSEVDGIIIQSVGGDGIRIQEAGGDAIRIDSSTNDALVVKKANGWSLNIRGDKNENTAPRGHIAILENQSATGSADVLALKVGL